VFAASSSGAEERTATGFVANLGSSGAAISRASGVGNGVVRNMFRIRRDASHISSQRMSANGFRFSSSRMRSRRPVSET
jgi:hypothetical protein